MGVHEFGTDLGRRCWTSGRGEAGVNCIASSVCVAKSTWQSVSEQSFGARAWRGMQSWRNNECVVSGAGGASLALAKRVLRTKRAQQSGRAKEQVANARSEVGVAKHN